MRVPKLFLAVTAIVATMCAAVIARADGTYAGPDGTGYVFSSNARSCLGTSAPNVCVFSGAFVYDASGRPVFYLATGSETDAAHITMALTAGGGDMKWLTPSPFAASVQLGGGSVVDVTRHTIEAGRPGGAFNTIRTGFYSADGTANGELYWYEVQGSTVFGVRATGRTWQVFSGALTLNTANATSMFEGNLLSCTSGAVCSVVSPITVQFPRNNQAVVTIGSTSTTLQSLVY